MSTDEMIDRPLRRDALRNRQRVLDAARELFAERGLKPNLNDVAHHAGLGVGTVYRRFATKEALIAALFEDGMAQLVTFADQGLDHEDPWLGFVWFVEKTCEGTATDKGLREIAFSRTYGAEHFTAAQDRLAPKLEQLVERAQAAGALRPGLSFSDMPLLALLAGMVTEFAGEVDPNLWRRYVAILLDGMRRQDDQLPLPVDALDDDGFDRAMRTWVPAGTSVVSQPNRART